MGLRLSRPRPDQGFQSIRIDDMFPLLSARTCETRLPTEAGILGIRHTVVPIISEIGANIVCLSLPQHGLGETISVPRYGTHIGYFAERPKRPRHGSRSGTGFTGRDFKDLGVCLRHYTSD